MAAWRQAPPRPKESDNGRLAL